MKQKSEQRKGAMPTVLIAAAHPDDAEIAMGGTAAKMVDAGWNVAIVDLTDGEPTPFGSKKIRSEETNKASEILGIQKRICLDMPNRYLQASLENRRILAGVIRATKPDILFSHFVPDWHPDHIAALALTNAARFEAKYHKTKMADDPYWTPKMFQFYSPHRLQYRNPSFIVDISDYWEKKIAAIQAYQSQLKNAPPGNQTDYIEKVTTVSRYFGQAIGVNYGEPFAASEAISVKNLKVLADTVTGD